jgi:hypothetical protein
MPLMQTETIDVSDAPQPREVIGGSWNVLSAVGRGGYAASAPDSSSRRIAAGRRSTQSSARQPGSGRIRTMLAPYWFEVMSTVDDEVLVYRDPMENRSTTTGFPNRSP